MKLTKYLAWLVGLIWLVACTSTPPSTPTPEAEPSPVFLGSVELSLSDSNLQVQDNDLVTCARFSLGEGTTDTSAGFSFSAPYTIDTDDCDEDVPNIALVPLNLSSTVGNSPLLGDVSPDVAASLGYVGTADVSDREQALNDAISFASATVIPRAFVSGTIDLTASAPFRGGIVLGIFSLPGVEAPDAAPTESAVVAEGNEDVVVFFPISAAAPEEVTITVTDESLNVDVEDFEAASQPVRIELPVAALSSIRTQADDDSGTYDGLLVNVETEASFPIDALTPASAVVRINGEHFLELPHIATSPTVNIPFEALRAYVDETGTSLDTLTLDVETYVLNENSLATQAMPPAVQNNPPASGPNGPLYTGMFYVSPEFSQLAQIDVDNYCNEPGSAFASQYFAPAENDFFVDDADVESGEKATKMPLILLHGWQGAGLDYMDFYEGVSGSPQSQHPALCGRYELINALQEAGLSENFEIFSFGYDSLRSIASNASYLHEEIQRVFGYRPVAIVAFSMGGMVTHDYIQNYSHNVQAFFPTNSPLMGSHTLLCIGSATTDCNNAFMNTRAVDVDGNPNTNAAAPIKATARSRRYIGTRNLAEQRADGSTLRFRHQMRIDSNFTEEDCSNRAQYMQTIWPWRVASSRISRAKWWLITEVYDYCVMRLETNTNAYLSTLNSSPRNLDIYHALTSGRALTGGVSRHPTSMLSGDYRLTDLVVTHSSQRLAGQISFTMRSRGNDFTHTHNARGGDNPVPDLLAHSFFEGVPFSYKLELVFQNALTGEPISATEIPPEDVNFCRSSSGILFSDSCDLYKFGYIEGMSFHPNDFERFPDDTVVYRSLPGKPLFIEETETFGTYVAEDFQTKELGPGNYKVTISLLPDTTITGLVQPASEISSNGALITILAPDYTNNQWVFVDETTSDSDGNFTFDDVDTGEYFFRVYPDATSTSSNSPYQCYRVTIPLDSSPLVLANLSIDYGGETMAGNEEDVVPPDEEPTIVDLGDEPGTVDSGFGGGTGGSPYEDENTGGGFNLDEGDEADDPSDILWFDFNCPSAKELSGGEPGHGPPLPPPDGEGPEPR